MSKPGPWQASCMSKTALPLLLALLCCQTVSALDLSTHGFFKHLVGEWNAEGELKGNENNTVSIQESWKGQADTEDSFSIEGTRTVNGDSQKFTWTFTRNPATDSYEAILAGGDGQPIRFEGSLSDVAGTLELKAITGNGSSSIAVQDRFADDSRDVLITKVTFTGEQGETTLQGTITHKRVKKA